MENLCSGLQDILQSLAEKHSSTAAFDVAETSNAQTLQRFEEEGEKWQVVKNVGATHIEESLIILQEVKQNIIAIYLGSGKIILAPQESKQGNSGTKKINVIAGINETYKGAKMSEDIKKFIIDCIEEARGDDLYRAKCAFRHYTPEQMNELYRLSSRTPRQMLDEYKAHNDKCDKAIEMVKETVK